MFPLYHTVLYRQSFSTHPFLSGWLSACHYTIWLNLIAWRCVARGSVGCGRKCCAAKLPRATCGASSRASIGQASPKSAKQIRSWGMTYRMEIVNEWTFDCLFPTQYIILSSAQQNLHDNLQFESQAKLLESKTLAHFTSRCNTPVKSIFFLNELEAYDNHPACLLSGLCANRAVSSAFAVDEIQSTANGGNDLGGFKSVATSSLQSLQSFPLQWRIMTGAALCGLSETHSAQRTPPKDLAAPGAAVHKADSNHLESTNRTKLKTVIQDVLSLKTIHSRVVQVTVI